MRELLWMLWKSLEGTLLWFVVACLCGLLGASVLIVTSPVLRTWGTLWRTVIPDDGGWLYFVVVMLPATMFLIMALMVAIALAASWFDDIDT